MQKSSYVIKFFNIYIRIFILTKRISRHRFEYGSKRIRIKYFYSPSLIFFLQLSALNLTKTIKKTVAWKEHYIPVL